MFVCACLSVLSTPMSHSTFPQSTQSTGTYQDGVADRNSTYIEGNAAVNVCLFAVFFFFYFFLLVLFSVSVYTTLNAQNYVDSKKIAPICDS